jgi:hypothetical protein
MAVSFLEQRGQDDDRAAETEDVSEPDGPVQMTVKIWLFEGDGPLATVSTVTVEIIVMGFEIV